MPGIQDVEDIFLRNSNNILTIEAGGSKIIGKKNWHKKASSDSQKRLLMIKESINSYWYFIVNCGAHISTNDIVWIQFLSFAKHVGDNNIQECQRLIIMKEVLIDHEDALNLNLRLTPF